MSQFAAPRFARKVLKILGTTGSKAAFREFASDPDGTVREQMLPRSDAKQSTVKFDFI
jgi:hypothetical protein